MLLNKKFLTIILGFGFLFQSEVKAYEASAGLSFWDNPDRIFKPVDRSVMILNAEGSQKYKFKKLGNFYNVKPSLNISYDENSRRMRDVNLTTSLLGVRPLSSGGFLGHGLSFGGISRFKNEFNIIPAINRHQELTQKNYFIEAQAFFEKSFTPKATFSSSLILRFEDYKTSYSIYVNQESDNINTAIQEAFTYKLANSELKTSLDFSRKYFKSRRALSENGFFVSEGDKLVPDIIDTTVISQKWSFKANQSTLSLMGQWTQVNDRVNGGRTYQGPGAGIESKTAFQGFNFENSFSVAERNYKKQLSSFQFISSTKKLEEFYWIFKGKTEYQIQGSKLASSLGIIYLVEKNLSNQKDTSNRKIGTYQTSQIGIELKKVF